MEKRAYAKPTILRVQLTHEQAVLSVCSVGQTNLDKKTGIYCRGTSTTKCRKDGGSGCSTDHSGAS